MKKMIKRFFNQQGESLVESLAAILIFTFASITMFSLCTAATNINVKVKKESKDMEQQLKYVETADVSAGTPGTGKIKITYGGKSSETDVYIYGEKKDDALFSYFKKP